MRRIGQEEPGPYSFLQLDEIRDQLRVEQESGESIRREIATERTLVTSTRGQYEALEAVRRQEKEEIQSATAPKQREAAVRTHELAQLTSRVSEAELKHHRETLKVMKLRAEASDLRARYLGFRVEVLRERTVFSQEDLDRQLAVFDLGEQSLREHLKQVQSRLRRHLRSRLTQSPSPEDSSASVGQHLHRVVCESAQQEAQLLQQVLEELVVARETWRRRFALANGQASQEQLVVWRRETDTALDRLEHLASQCRLRTAQLHKERTAKLSTITGQEIEVDADISHGNDTESQEAIGRIVEVYGNTLVLIEKGQRLHGRFVEELEEELIPSSLAGVVDTITALGVHAWKYELLAVEDRPITVGKLTSGVLLVLVGCLLARLFSRFVGRRVLPRLGVNRGASTAIQSVLFYALLISVFFISLELVNVPLTIFAFLGGAVAIGLGFGSQNILNNFISGLILLVERPIRMGDLVNVDGIDATIERIGARSTRVRTGDNLDILVPNSKFLENNVTNWTLSDTRIRKKVTVGVAYGSPVDRVAQLLESCVLENEQVLPTPHPIVLFKEFADNSLNFEVHFWIHMRTIMEGAIVESSIRHAVDAAFRQEGITIAFPQRDVHLNLESAVPVHLLQPGEEKQAEPFRRAA
ncbi:MAG: mechanosensitive ion channel domain-containing protein [Planctomycetota bacterium]